jgi:hypothetical protein
MPCLDDDDDSMAPDPAVAVSFGGGSSGASRRCLAPPEIGTYFIIDQYIEKLRHNSQLRTTRLNNYHAHFYPETDSYLILGP